MILHSTSLSHGCAAALYSGHDPMRCAKSLNGSIRQIRIRSSVVGIATTLRAGRSGFPIQWVAGVFPGVKRPRLGAELTSIYRENYTKSLVRMERRERQKRAVKKGRKELMAHLALSEVERKGLVPGAGPSLGGGV